MRFSEEVLGATTVSRMDAPDGTVPHADRGFADLVAAIREATAGRDPRADAALVWTALHGLVTLRASRPDEPWPDPDALVTRLALLRDGSA
ncbi:TetR-like C-terminal domain-containing protein [Geodermatophilus sp. SYSU D01062]